MGKRVDFGKHFSEILTSPLHETPKVIFMVCEQTTGAKRPIMRCHKTLGIGRAAILALLLVVSGQTAVGNDTPCLSRDEADAHELRFVQMHLMVAALVCRRSGLHFAEQAYNRFVMEHETSLKASTPVLRSYLRRTGGPDIDAFMTAQANELALEAALIPGFCGKMHAALKARVDKITSTDFVDASGLPIAYSQPVRSCAVQHIAKSIAGGSVGSDVPSTGGETPDAAGNQ